MKHNTTPVVPPVTVAPAAEARRRGPQPLDPKQLAMVAGGVTDALSAPKGTWSALAAPKGTWA